MVFFALLCKSSYLIFTLFLTQQYILNWKGVFVNFSFAHLFED